MGEYWNRHGFPSVCLYLDTILSGAFLLQCCTFIHNVCVNMKLCMCSFHDRTIITCGIISPWTCKFYWIIVVQRNNPTVLHVLNSKLHTMLLVVCSSAGAIFITIMSLVADLSPLELVNFTKSLLSRAFSYIFVSTALKFTHKVCVCIVNFTKSLLSRALLLLLHFCKYCAEIYT